MAMLQALAAPVGPLSQLGGASFQLARALSPFLRQGARSLFNSACQASQPALAVDVPPTCPAVLLPKGPSSPDTTALESHHSTQPFSTLLGHYRSAYPEAVWSKLAGLAPRGSKRPPLAIDIAVGSEGRAGVELAMRGFQVLSVGSTPEIIARTFQCASAHRACINLIPAKVERDMVHANAADLVTCMHGLHLLSDPQAALQEAHRILRPGGKLVVAFNDRDLGHGFVDMLEDVVEAHIPGYRRASCQHPPEAWAATLRAGGLFRMMEFNSLPNPVVLRNLATLSDILNAQPYVREALSGPARKAFNMDLRSLAELCFGEGPLLLPMQTRLFILEKI